MSHDRLSDKVFEFVGPHGYILAGRIDRPETSARAWAMLVHGASDSDAAARIARALAIQGIGVVTFSFAPGADDLVTAAAAMSSSRCEPALVVGLGVAGAAVAVAARAIPSVRAVAAIGAPDNVVAQLLKLDPGVLTRRADGKDAAATIAAWAARHLVPAGGSRSGTLAGLARAA